MNTAVAILYYNKINITASCVDSLISGFSSKKDIYLVSNGSEEKNFILIKSMYPGLNYLHKKENAGYSGGFNFALNKIFSKGYDAVFFLTNDTEIKKSSINYSIDTACTTGAGLVAPTIYFMRDRKKIDSSGGFFDRKKYILCHYQTTDQPELLGNDDYIPGTALLVTKAAFNKLGGMDEEYGTYWDDADFSFRARSKGISMARSKKSVVYHLVGRTCHKKPLYTTFYFHRNRIIFCKKFLSEKEFQNAEKIIRSELNIMLENAEERKDSVRLDYIKKIFSLF